MAFKLDKKIFTYLIIAMAVIIVVMVGLLVINALGNISLFPSPSPTPTPGGSTEEETGPWGQKNFSWEYSGITHSANIYIAKDTYQYYQYGISGAVIPDDLADYIVTFGDDWVIADTARQINAVIGQQDYSDADAVGLVLAFVRSINYQTDRETGHSPSYPRAPAVTLAEQTGDSGDHAILAAAILEELGYACGIVYYPSTYDRLSIIPDAAALGLVSDDNRYRPVYTVSDETTGETLPIAPFWAVDTDLKGFPTAAYDGITPQILTGKTFWTGKHYTPTDGKDPSLNITDTFLLKESNDLTFSPRDWQQNVSAYYADSWYPSGVSWTMEDKWQLYQQYVTIQDIPPTLYTPWGTAVYNATVPWRIVYQITGMDSDHSDQDMTPYSDVRIAVYSLDETTGSAELIKVFGWQTLYGADLYRTVGPFSPGNYAVAVFVRNAAVDVSLEYHGKAGTPEYAGGI